MEVIKKKRGRPKAKSEPPLAREKCGCKSCRSRAIWQKNYTGIVAVYDIGHKDDVERWRCSYECWLELHAPAPEPEPTAEVINDSVYEAVRAGKLRIRKPGRIWAPLLSGECESCEGLRPATRRFCLQCEAKMRSALESQGWTIERVEAYLAVPHGTDPFLSKTEKSEKISQSPDTAELIADTTT